MVCEGFIFLEKTKQKSVPYTKTKMNESPKSNLTNNKNKKGVKNKAINGQFLSR